MMAKAASGFFRAFALCLGMIAGLVPLDGRAQEACGEATTGACYPDYLTIPALAATDSGYTAIAATAAGDLEVLRLDQDGQIIFRFPLPPPDWLQGANMPSIEKLVAGPEGDVMGVGTLTSGNRQYGVLFLLSASGDTAWSTALHAGDENSLILYSGAYDPAGRRYLAVGRHTDGADSGSCTKWSRGLVISVAEDDMAALSGHFEGEQTPGPQNRIAFYDIAPTGNSGQFVAAGFATAPKPDGDGCQDNAVAYLVRGGKDAAWSVTSRYTIGLPDTNEVAFAVAPSASQAFMMGGQGALADGARAAFLAEFQFNSSAPELRNDPFPQDGSDNSGGDRYRSILRLENGSFVVAGSVSESRRARNQGIWRVQSADTASRAPLNFLTREAGSDIFAIALGRDGRVLAAGRHGTDRDDIGWMGFIYGLKVAVDRRAPDGSLDLLTPQQASAGGLSLSSSELATGLGFRDIRIRAGSEYEVRFSVSGTTGLAASALPIDGDIDLALLDAAGKVIAISSNLEDAGEFVLADLAAGDYALKIVAVSEVSEYELRIRSGASLAGPIMESLNALDQSGRRKLAALLRNGGYNSPANADIAFGGGSLRSLLAFYNSFSTTTDAAGVQQFVASTSLSADDE